MTKTVTTNWEHLVKGWKFLDPDKAVTNPAKYFRNSKTPLRTHRHNKAVLFRRG